MSLRMICTVLMLLAFFSTSRLAFGDGPAAPRLTDISLTRTGDGKGTGPEDELILRANGTALYKGLRNVDRIGLYTGDVPSHGFEPPMPLLAKMYESLHRQPHSTGKPTGGVTAIRVKVIWDG